MSTGRGTSSRRGRQPARFLVTGHLLGIWSRGFVVSRPAGLRRLPRRLGRRRVLAVLVVALDLADQGDQGLDVLADAVDRGLVLNPLLGPAGQLADGAEPVPAAGPLQ